MRRNIFFVGIMLSIMAVGALSLSTRKSVAEDEDDDREEMGDAYESRSEKDSGQAETTPTAIKENQTAAPSPAKKTVITVIKDTDGDGILDDADPHPTIPEMYIVKDENKNGIVDTLETPEISP